MNQDEKDECLEFARDMALKAGEIMRQYYRADQLIEKKLDHSPVTIADKQINSLLIENVKQTFPEHGVLGEEEVWLPDRTKLWVCDPIDGTHAYIMKIPVAMFSLAYVVAGEPLVAVAYNPITNELFHAVKDQGAFLNHEPIQVSQRAWGSRSRLVKSDSERFKERWLGDSDTLSQIAQEGVHTTTCPGAVFRACGVASGSFDGCMYYGDGAHDVAATKLIVEEAGGKVTSLMGKDQVYNQAIRGAIITNQLIHDELVTRLKNYQASDME